MRKILLSVAALPLLLLCSCSADTPSDNAAAADNGDLAMDDNVAVPTSTIHHPGETQDPQP